MPPDPFRYFRVEAAELLQQLGQLTLDLEKGPAPERVGQMLRLAHTLKGAARVVRQKEIADVAHAIEEVLGPFREVLAAVPRTAIDKVLHALDEIARRVAGLDAPLLSGPSTPVAPGEPRPSVPLPPAPREPFRTVRVAVAEIDGVLDGLVEANAELVAARRSGKLAEQLRRSAELLSAVLERESESSRRSGGGTAARSSLLAGELGGAAAALEREIAGAFERLEKQLAEVRDATERLRLTPAAPLLTLLERTTRDVAGEQGKRVRFLARGGEVRLDGHVLEALQGALVQLVRNAVAHGIETPAERQARGKPEAGEVLLEICGQGARVAFTCADDGRGVDVEAVRMAAILRGATEVPTSRSEVLDLLLRGGLSTSRQVSTVAGRGIGLDVVRDTVERLRGQIELASEPGRGTRVTLTVPVLLAEMVGLDCEAAGQAVTVPLAAVVATRHLAAGEIGRSSGRLTMEVDGVAVPFSPLASLLGGPPVPLPERGAVSAIVLRSAAGSAALGVDRLRGTGRFVLRPLPELVPRCALVAGATLDVEGNPRLVLDPAGAVAAVEKAPGLVPIAPDRRRRALVVDDSLTTRMLEQSILESAGFEVALASSGEEGLTRALASRFDVFLVDIEMPGMDGFEFIARAGSVPQLAEIPAILVSSRFSAADRRRGEEVGARAYIAKGEFDQGVLLAEIRRLLR